jgi:hypothetical protein
MITLDPLFGFVLRDSIRDGNEKADLSFLNRSEQVLVV